METIAHENICVPDEIEAIEIDLQCLSIEDFTADLATRREVPPTRALVGAGLSQDQDGIPVVILTLYHPQNGVMNAILREQSVDMIAHKLADYVELQNAQMKRRNALPPRLVQ